MTRLGSALRLALVLATFGAAFAQFDLRGEVEWAGDAVTSEGVPTQAGWSLAAHLAGEYDASPVTLQVVLDPRVRFGPSVTVQPGLTEAFAVITNGSTDLSAGIERLPLETARLSVPFSVESISADGTRRGVPGVRLESYLGDWRMRGAAFLHGRTGSLAGLMSVRRNFGTYEVEVHGVYEDGLAAGIGGSGLLGDVVLYGEAWLLTHPLETRGALGLAGSLPNGSWTLEGAHLPPDGGVASAAGTADPGPPTPPSAPRPVVHGQLAWVLDDRGDRSLSVSGATAFDPDAVRSRVLGTYTAAGPERSWSWTVGGAFGPEPAAFTIRSSVVRYF